MRAASPEIVEEVQRYYECWVRQDFDAMLEWYAPDAEVDLSQLLPDEGVIKGRDELLGLCERMWEVWSGIRWEPYEVIEAAPDMLVVLTRIGGEGRGSGVQVDSELTMVYTLRDGKVTRLVYHPTREAALEAAGAEG